MEIAPLPQFIIPKKAKARISHGNGLLVLKVNTGLNSSITIHTSICSQISYDIKLMLMPWF